MILLIILFIVSIILNIILFKALYMLMESYNKTEKRMMKNNREMLDIFNYILLILSCRFIANVRSDVSSKLNLLISRQDN